MNWKNSPIACIDVETTGKDCVADRVVELAVVIGRIDGGGVDVVERRSWLVNPQRPIPAEATSVHGITDEMVAEALPFVAIWQEVRLVIADAIPCAYNEEFDRGCITSEWLRAFGHFPPSAASVPGLLHRDATWLDPLPWSRHFCRFMKGGHTLGVVADRLGVAGGVAGDAHRATHDAEIALRIMASLGARTFDPVQPYRSLYAIPGTLEEALEVQEMIWFASKARYCELFRDIRRKEGRPAELRAPIVAT